MSWTKYDLITQAYAAIGLSEYAFDLQPDQLEAARKIMDAMVTGWESRGIRIGYRISAGKNDDIRESLDIPDSTYEAIYTGLAVRLAPRIGKSVDLSILRIAHTGYKQLLSNTTHYTTEQNRPGMPLGAGHKGRGGRYTQPDDRDPVEVGNDGPLSI